AEPEAGDQVISGETLRRAGANRLSDVLLLAAGWDVSTVDGFTWHAAPLGGGPFLPARWTVLVDGRRVDPDLFGTTSIDRLGVPLDQVSSVELSELPRLEAGELTGGGLIHIRTVEPPTGPSARGRFTTGSEIGDPGPFAFTPEPDPNVDRMGHQASVGFGYGGGSWFADATVGWEELVPTDPAIAERYRAAIPGRPRLYNTAPTIRAGARLGGGTHEAVFRQSRAGGALGLIPLVKEIATAERLTLVGIAGRMPAGAGELAYDVSHSVQRARSRRGAPGPPLDWDARRTEARVELVRRRSPLQHAGVRLRRLAVHSPASLSEPGISLGSGYAAVRLGSGPAVPTASASITVGEGEVGVAALLSRRWRLSSRSSLEGLLLYERTSRAEDNSIWAWTERGYDLLPEGGAAFEVVGTLRSPEHLGADLAWSSRLRPGLLLSARALYRRSRGLSLERRELHFVAGAASFEGPTVLIHGAGGERTEASLEVQARPVRGLDLRVSYWLRGTAGGDSLYRDVWATVPRHGARGTVEYVPVTGLELWMAASYRGASRWPDFAAVGVESGGRYRERVNGAFTLDLAIQKLLWNGRLRAHFGVRNVLGASLRYHPAGATFAPTAVLQLEGNLPPARRE
ncbi:MAG TPA: Plug domain-containing protein, partial [Gemmatimonadales bacterium]|nr:Plug domain-containing protein [Gemmatimonadales bacterium]